MPDMPDTPDIAALLGSRICHDLISPLGAIGNGLELLSMSGTTAGPEMALIAESVANASARIRFFRVAFGATAATARLARPEILSILADNTRGARLRIDWQVAGDLPRREVKLAFLVLQCLESAMPYGGTITVTRDDGGWQARGVASKLKADAGLWASLARPAAETVVEAAQVQFMLLPAEAARQNRTLSIDLREIEIRVEW